MAEIEVFQRHIADVIRIRDLNGVFIFLFIAPRVLVSFARAYTVCSIVSGTPVNVIFSLIAAATFFLATVLKSFSVSKS